MDAEWYESAPWHAGGIMGTVGIIGGTNADFGFDWRDETVIETPFGEVPVVQGTVPGTAAEVRLVRRHGTGHELLSSSVAHRANIRALRDAGCMSVVGTTVCGVLDPRLPLGTAIVFDDLYFPDNRLPDGSPCTFFSRPGEPGRGHYIFGSPFSGGMRTALIEAAERGGVTARDAGTYAYALGPRFSTRAEIAAFRAAGACAVSQTAGPEAVLAGELELPYALVGFGVDYANGVMAEPTPLSVLDENIMASKRAFETILAGACAALGDASFDQGFVYRFE